METGIIFENRPEKVIDLGTGHSNVHNNIEEVIMTGEDGLDVIKYKADVERVSNELIEDYLKI